MVSFPLIPDSRLWMWGHTNTLLVLSITGILKLNRGQREEENHSPTWSCSWGMWSG